MATDMSSLDDDQRTLFSALPPDGSSVGNAALRQYLRWSQARYFGVRDELVERGLVVRGRGRGGAVRRTEPEPLDELTVSVTVATDATVAATVDAVIDTRLRESALYEPMREVINGAWARDRLQDLLAVEITAQQGRGNGVWSRPDIVTVEVRTFQYVPGKHLEINTFEVKPPWAVTVQAVYEALAHRRAATRSYVLLHIPSEQYSALDNAVAAVAETARMYGVGAVVATDPSDYDTWDEREEAQRFEPDPERLDNFIATQLSAETRHLISKRLR